MGAWSTRIFDDDGAADIRDEYKILLGYGMEQQEAYDRIEEYFLPDYQGEDDEDVYWLSVALYQWQNGILMDNVKQKALDCIENKSYLERWEEDEKVYLKRQKVLEELKNRLIYEVNPIRKKFPKCPKCYRYKTIWEVGDLLSYQIITNVHDWPEDEIGKRIAKSEKDIWNKYVLLRVIKISKIPVSLVCPQLDYASIATVMLYDWCGKDLPSMEEIGKMSFRPIIVSYWSEVKQIVSGVALDVTDEKKVKDNCIITLLGNDKNFNNTPILYNKNRNCPIKIPIHFNIDLAMTFALRDGDMTEWHYKK